MLYGDAHNDVFHASDSDADTLFGGSGTDNAADRDTSLDVIPNGDIETL